MDVKTEVTHAKEISSYYSIAAEEHDESLGYILTEVGSIPRDWEITRLGRICSMKSGIGITSASIDEFSRYPCFGGNGIRGFTERFTHSGRFSLIGRQGALCGNVVLAEGKFFASEHAIIVTPSTKTDTDWLFFVLDRMHLNEFSESSAQPGLSVSKILLLRVACPPLFEQRAIAKALSGADALIESLEQLLTKKRQIKKGAMQELLTGKKRLSGFRGEWEEKCIWEIADCLDNLRVPLNDAQRSRIKGDYPYCGANGVLDYIDRYCIDDAVVLIAEDGGYFDEHATRPIAYRMSGKFWVNNHAHILKSRPEFSQDYLFYSLVHKNILSYLASGTRSKLNKSEMNKITIWQPHGKAEQTAIAAVLSDMDEEISALESKLSKARQLKQGMTQELLTGRIRLI